MDFSIRLANLIEEKDIKQKDLSAEFHIAPTTLNGYVNNYREPDFETLVRLAKYFEVSTDYLLGLSDTKKPYPAKLSAKEGALVDLYRCLLPDRQELLLEQARMYYQHDQKKINKKLK